MDFAVCPACKQSVLDDDAVNCPFCSAPMKGKPGAAKPIAAPKTSAAKTVPAKVAPKVSAPIDDAAFDLGNDLGSDATQATASRTKIRTMLVKCPMCETLGYVPPSAAGQAVKCANHKCLVPVFTAPVPVVEKPKPPPPKPKRSLAVVGGVTAALMAVGGGLAYWIASQPQNTTLKGPSQADLDLIKEITSNEPLTPTANQPTQSAPPPEEPTPDQTDIPVEAAQNDVSQAALLKMMTDAALQPRQNRSKPFCRRLTAEAFALIGNLDGAQAQLTALDRVGKDVPFYRVSPLVEIGWQQLARKDRKAAAKSAEQALQAAASLPKTARDRLESAIALSAFLIATKREADAETLLAAHHTSDATAQLAAIRRMVLAYGVFDLSETDARRPALNWHFPLHVAVVHELVAHQQTDVARKWAAKLSSPRTQTETLAAWAEGVVWQPSLSAANIDIPRLQSALEKLPSPGNAWAVARLGVALSLAGQTAPAEACLTAAAGQINQTTPFAEESLPEGVAALSKFRPSDSAPREFLAAACGEAAHLASRLGQTEQAETLLDTALTQLRSIAPNAVAVQQRLQLTESAGINSLRDELRTQLKLKTADEAIVAANAYKRNLDDWMDAAQFRVALQTQLLTAAVAWGQLDPVWNYIRRGTSAADAAEADNLIFTALPSLLAERYQAAGKTDRAELVTAAWNQLVPDKQLAPPPAAVLSAALLSQMPGSLDAALRLMKDWKSPPAEQDLLAMRVVGQAAAQGAYEPALKFTGHLTEPVLKEECYLLIAGIAGKQGKTKLIETQAAELNQASEKVALGRGLLAGQAIQKAQLTEKEKK